MMSQTGRRIDFSTILQRLRRLAMLDTTVFDEVRTDTDSTIPALIVTIIATFLAGIGGWLWWIFNDVGAIPTVPGGGEIFVQSVIVGSIVSVLLWSVWLAIAYVMLTQVFRARADLNELVRVMGFASAPLALTLLMFIPGIDFGVGLAALALFFGANLVAVQTVTDADAGRVLVATAAGFAVWAIVLGLLVNDGNVFAPGFFALDLPVEQFQEFA